MTVPVTLIHSEPCGRRRRRDVDLWELPRAGDRLHGALSTLHLRVVDVEQALPPARSLVVVEIINRPSGVPGDYWAGWSACECR